MKLRARLFLDLAQKELKSGQVLYKHGLTGQSMYMLSQAAEKATRALMEEEDIPQITGHNFGALAARFPDDHPFKQRVAEFLPLSGASTKYRYPSETQNFEPRPAMLEKALADVETFVGDMKRYLVQADFRTKLDGP